MSQSDLSQWISPKSPTNLGSKALWPEIASQTKPVSSVGIYLKEGCEPLAIVIGDKPKEFIAQIHWCDYLAFERAVYVENKYDSLSYGCAFFDYFNIAQRGAFDTNALHAVLIGLSERIARAAVLDLFYIGHVPMSAELRRT